MDTTIVLLAVSAVFLGALMRAVFGFGDSVVSMPLLALLPLDLKTSIALVGLTGFSVAILAILSGWENVDRPVLKDLSVGTLIGIPVGLLLVTFASQSLITFILGIFLVFYGIYSLTKARTVEIQRSSWIHRPIWANIFGFMAGTLGSAYNMNGIPIVVYGTMREWKPIVFRESLQAHFLMSSSFIILGHFLGGFWTNELLVLYLFSLPLTLLAHLIGKVVYGKIPTHKFERYIFILIVFLGISLLIN
ncbi:MAG: sulfite exporter TauE/SafE family protein [Tetragenococcus koreensis]|nr:sulfite exporter TauE/SafE family protein [Lactococcus lactis]MDN6423597.1 sulfite exporter TauE/SafE family protein [Tetragenococcus koreensis]